MVPQPTDDQIAAHYRSKFSEGNYELIRRFAPQYRPVYEGFLKVVQDAFTSNGLPLAGRSILEVGCFTGDFLLLAAQAGCRVRGLELQDEAVAIAETRLPGCIFKIDVNDHGWDGSSYDAVCLFGVVEHVRDPRWLIHRAAELLNPGGFVFIQTPDSSSWLARAMGRFWPPVAPVEHINLLSRQGLQRCLLEAGLETIGVRAHIKALPIEYVFEMMRNFGPELRALLEPAYAILPRRIRATTLPLYAGEILVTAQKRVTAHVA